MLLFIFSLQFVYMHVCSVALVMSNSLQLYGLYFSGSCVHGIFQARLLEWVAISFSKGSSPTQGSNPHFQHLLHYRQILYHQPPRKPLYYYYLFSVFSLGAYKVRIQLPCKRTYMLLRNGEVCTIVYLCEYVCV